MVLFLSTFHNKVDKKGRVSVPATFRAALASQSFAGVVAYSSFINPCIEACGMERIEKISTRIETLDPYSDEYDAFTTTILGGSVQLGFDGEGRILLPEALVTEEARAALAKFRADGGTGGWAGGTVGAVAVDAAGQLAAGTSTGGTLGKRVGRLGDSPIIGAGTLADDSSCAVSCTGDGEAILKLGLSQLAASYLRAGESAEQAARLAVTRLQERLQGAAGLILVTPQGRFAWARSTATMSFAVVGAGGEQAGI